MGVTLITGPHQSGKSRRLWQGLRGEAAGTAVLVTPGGGMGRELAREVHGWHGPGLLPAVISLAELVERCAGGAGDGLEDLGVVQAAHLLRPWCASGLAGGPWAAVSGFRATARELADLCLRLDAALVEDGELARLAAVARADGDGRFAAGLETLVRARAHLAGQAAKRGLATPGNRLRRLAAAPAVPWSAIYCDDLISLSPAQVGLLAGLAATRRVVLTAVDDDRLGPGALVERLRRVFPAALEERCVGVHPRSAHAPGARLVLERLLRADAPLPAPAVALYHYRDPQHAGRAIAAWLKRAGVAPGDAVLYLRACDQQGLALADALLGAEVPVVGTFHVPWTGTAAGGLFLRLAAWCRRGGWREFAAVCERLWGGLTTGGAGLPDARAPERLADLASALGEQPAPTAIAQLAALDSGRDIAGWQWREAGPGRPRLRALVAWLRAWHQVLEGGGPWLARLAALCARLGLADAADEALRRLADLERLGPLGDEEVQEVCRDLVQAVERGVGADPAQAVAIHDAVRDRSRQRRVAIVHGLEHGTWPGRPGRGSLLTGAERRVLAGSLADTGDGRGDRDPFDEAGQGSGEVATFLAVVARGRERVVLGCPCGEREPSPWLAAILGQCARDLDAERARGDDEAVAGAPLAPADSQGAHERALWAQDPQPLSFAFRIGAQPLRFSPSELGTLLADPFCLWCERLHVAPPLDDVRRRALGIELHQLLADLVRDLPDQPELWGEEAGTRLGDWIAGAADAFARGERARLTSSAIVAMTNEGALFASAGGAPGVEEALKISLAVGDRQLALNGRADRIDRLADGRVRIVDYKLGGSASYRAALRDGTEGQLLAYCAAFPGQLASAHFRSLADGGMAGYRAEDAAWDAGRAKPVPLDELPARTAALGAAIAAFVAGQASTGPGGLCAARGFAPIARLDEARLDLGGGEDADGEPDGAPPGEAP